MSWIRSAARVMVMFAVIYGAGLAVARLTGPGVVVRAVAMIAVTYVIVMIIAKRRKSGRYRKDSKAGSPGAFPRIGAGAGAGAGAGTGAGACVGAGGCALCSGPFYQVYVRSGGGRVASAFYQQAMIRGFALDLASWNDIAELSGSRFVMTASDELGEDYTGEVTDITSALGHITARYGPAVPGSGYTRGGRLVPAPNYIAQGIPQWQSLPSWQPLPHAAPPGVTPGIPGFSGAGALAVPAQETVTGNGLVVPDSFEPVRGYRWWTLNPAPVDLAPTASTEVWPMQLLRGARDTWQPGENIAGCLAGGLSTKVHPDADIPLDACGCGFWCYWQLQHHELSSSAFPVCGVVEGYGAVIIGEKGFRSAKARIIALAVPFTIIPVPAARRMPGSGWSRAGFEGTVHYYGMENPDRFRMQDIGAAREAEQRDRADAEAWMGIISDRISVLYPGVRVFETVGALMAMFPPDKTYGGTAQTCPDCGQPAGDLYRHRATECHGSARW